MKNKKAMVIGFMVVLIVAMLLGALYIFIREGRVEYSLLAVSALTVSTIIRYNKRPTHTDKTTKKAPSLKAVEEAYQQYLPHVFEDRSQTKWQLLKALQRYNLHEYVETFQDLEKMLPLASNNYEKSTLNFFMGLSANADGIYDLAVHCYQSAIHFNPDLPSVHSNLGVVYTKLNRYSEAMEMLQMAIEKKPEVSFPYLNLADLYVKLNEGDKALEVAKKGLVLNPKDVLAYQKIAMAYAVKGDKDKCFENIKAMTDLGYDSTENMISLCNRILDKDPELWKL